MRPDIFILPTVGELVLMDPSPLQRPNRVSPVKTAVSPKEMTSPERQPTASDSYNEEQSCSSCLNVDR